MKTLFARLVTYSIILNYLQEPLTLGAHFEVMLVSPTTVFAKVLLGSTRMHEWFHQPTNLPTTLSIPIGQGPLTFLK